MAHSASGLGASLLIIAIVPIMAAMVITGNFGLLTGANLWYTLGLAFAVGVGAGITVLGSGLSSESIVLAFTLAFGTTLYGLFVGVTIADIPAIPYNGGAIISGFSLLFYVVGMFLIVHH